MMYTAAQIIFNSVCECSGNDPKWTNWNHERTYFPCNRSTLQSSDDNVTVSLTTMTIEQRHSSDDNQYNDYSMTAAMG